MKLVHSEAMLSQVHSNIWIITVLFPDGARACRPLLETNGRATADQSHNEAKSSAGAIMVSLGTGKGGVTDAGNLWGKTGKVFTTLEVWGI